MRFTAILFSVLVVPTAALGQSTTACKSIADAMARRACFDKLRAPASTPLLRSEVSGKAMAPAVGKDRLRAPLLIPLPKSRPSGKAAPAEDQGNLQALLSIPLPKGADPAAAPTEEQELLSDAQVRITRLLRDPDSAKFSDLKVHVTHEGEKVVCGQVNARNALGGMTGPKHFYVDSTINRIVVSARADENPMSIDGDILNKIYLEGVETHLQYCK